jgi:formamidopyrimidine-DNA glycosylase
MPEGPEVRKYADALDAVLSGRAITSLEARTREAKTWLQEQGSRLLGRRVLTVSSHGKHLLGHIEGGFYFHSHLMMWGRWQTYKANDETASGRRAIRAGGKSGGERPQQILPDEKDRRERARIVVEGGAAVLLSAPIFNVGEGDPYKQIENLSTLGPDVLPYPNSSGNRVFDETEFRRRLLLPEHLEITIGAALLNQQILAGVGNYLRAEILFSCGLSPWRKVGDLNKQELKCLGRAAPELSLRSYAFGATVPDDDRERMALDPSLVYQPGREYGTRHFVFRRTNLPCLRCGGRIKQLRQATCNSSAIEAEEERTRIVYFCPQCQNVRC